MVGVQNFRDEIWEEYSLLNMFKIKILRWEFSNYKQRRKRGQWDYSKDNGREKSKKEVTFQDLIDIYVPDGIKVYEI